MQFGCKIHAQFRQERLPKHRILRGGRPSSRASGGTSFHLVQVLWFFGREYCVVWTCLKCMFRWQVFCSLSSALVEIYLDHWNWGVKQIDYSDSLQSWCTCAFDILEQKGQVLTHDARHLPSQQSKSRTNRATECLLSIGAGWSKVCVSWYQHWSPPRLIQRKTEAAIRLLE